MVTWMWKNESIKVTFMGIVLVYWLLPVILLSFKNVINASLVKFKIPLIQIMVFLKL